jgi:hypothetical protein
VSGPRASACPVAKDINATAPTKEIQEYHLLRMLIAPHWSLKMKFKKPHNTPKNFVPVDTECQLINDGYPLQ